MGRTRPCSVTSPVMPTVLRTARPVSRLTIAVVIVTPADGPSLGTAPAGTWMWKAFSIESASMPRSPACDRTYESAICADSFMTSPSWPVRIRLPWPFEAVVAVASTKSTSPPTPVTARPVATPGTDVRAATSLSNLGLPRNSRTRCCVISTGGVSALVVLQSRLLDLALHQVVLRDRDLLLLRVAVEPDELHAVQQGRRDRLRHVGGGDEQHLGQVEVDLEVVVAERVVLRGVEHLEQRRRRVAPPVAADLVDLVEHDHRVLGPGFFQRAHDPAWKRPDVGAPVAANVRLVADSAQGHARELAAQRAGDRLAQRRLAGPGRADQGDDRAGAT